MKTLEKKNEKGFSLIELMIAISVSTIIVFAIYIVMRAGDEQMKAADVKMAIQDTAREGLYKMMQDIRLSAPNRVTIGGGGTSIQFSIPDVTSPLNADFTVNWNNAHVIIYALGGTNNRQLIRTDTTTGTTRVIANDVTSIVFAGDATPPQIVTVTMNVQRSMINARQMTATPLQLVGRAELRNA